MNERVDKLTRRGFKVRRLHNNFLTRFGGRDMKQTTYNVIRTTHIKSLVSWYVYERLNSCCHCQSDNFHLLHVNINISSILLECRSTLLSLQKIDPAVEEAVPSKVTEWCQHIENAT